MKQSQFIKSAHSLKLAADQYSPTEQLGINALGGFGAMVGGLGGLHAGEKYVPQLSDWATGKGFKRTGRILDSTIGDLLPKVKPKTMADLVGNQALRRPFRSAKLAPLALMASLAGLGGWGGVKGMESRIAKKHSKMDGPKYLG